MKKELTGVAARVYPLIENTVHECGCEIWDLEFVKEGADRILRITIDTDREGGIGKGKPEYEYYCGYGGCLHNRYNG